MDDEDGTKQATIKDKYDLKKEDFRLNDREIIAMEYSSKFESLYIVFKNHIVQLKTRICERYKNRPKNKIWDSYCPIICQE